MNEYNQEMMDNGHKHFPSDEVQITNQYMKKNNFQKLNHQGNGYQITLILVRKESSSRSQLSSINHQESHKY